VTAAVGGRKELPDEPEAEVVVVVEGGEVVVPPLAAEVDGLPATGAAGGGFTLN
jgi:hypothetical protein